MLSSSRFEHLRRVSPQRVSRPGLSQIVWFSLGASACLCEDPVHSLPLATGSGVARKICYPSAEPAFPIEDAEHGRALERNQAFCREWVEDYANEGVTANRPPERNHPANAEAARGFRTKGGATHGGSGYLEIEVRPRALISNSRFKEISSRYYELQEKYYLADAEL